MEGPKACSQGIADFEEEENWPVVPVGPMADAVREREGEGLFNGSGDFASEVGLCTLFRFFFFK